MNSERLASRTKQVGKWCCALIYAVLAPISAWAQGSPDIIWLQSSNSDRINSVIFTFDGNTVISGGSDRLIHFWAASDGSLQRTLNQEAPSVHASSIEGLALSPDSARLASVNYQTVKLWKLSSGQASILSGHTDWVVGCAFSSNGKWLATASFDGTVRIWQGTDGTPLKSLSSPGQVRAVAFSPDSQLLASGGGDTVVTLRRTSDWSVVARLAGHIDDIDTVAFSPDGTTLASGSYDRTVKVWDVNSGSLLYTVGNNGGTIYAVAFSPDGSRLAYTDGEGNTIRLVRVSDGALIKTYTDNVNQVQTLAFSPSGLLAYGRVDRTVVLARVGGSDPTNSSPTKINIASPNQNQAFVSPADIVISATASASSGIANVQFFQNGQSLGVVGAAPFKFDWQNVPNGNYTISATATANDGTTASDSVAVTVGDAPPEKVKPKVVISSPAPNARVTTGTVLVTGKASDNVGVSEVLVSLNSGDFLTADGTTAWQISLDLNPGLNTVQAVSVDTSGNRSAVAKRSFTYVVTSPLTMTISGNGKVSPNYDGKTLVVGKVYSMKATPASGYVFQGWSGDVSSSSSTLTFPMAQNMTVQATFIPNPFIPLVGTYRGLFLDDPASVDGTGYLQTTVSSSGSMSAKLYYGKTVVSFTGKFNGDGTFSKSIPRSKNSPLILDLLLHLNDDSDQITGTITDGSNTSALTADRAVVYNRTNPAPQAGRYTFNIPGNSANADSPQGTGYGTVVVATTGAVSLSGRLADNVAFTASSALSKNSTWPLFSWLNSGNEVVAGQITAEDKPGVSDMDGTVNWFKRATSARMFAAGFGTQNPFVGSRFVAPPSGTSVLDFGTNAPNALVIFRGGNLDAEQDISGTLNQQNRLVSVPPGTLKMSITRTNGLFSGTFLNTTTSKTVSFSGAVLQKQNNGAGFFLGTDQSGSVTVQSQ